MARPPIPSWFFALAVMRRGDRFLLVRESSHGQLWYFPAGRVEPGQTFAAAAERETLAEAGVPVPVDGSRIPGNQAAAKDMSTERHQSPRGCCSRILHQLMVLI